MEFNQLQGKILTQVSGLEIGNDQVIFTTSDGDRFQMYHQQDCCESVQIEDVTGDVEDLLNTPILRAEEREEGLPNEYESLWTFYELATIHGAVTIRWLGTSEYYSVSVDFEKLD